MKKAFTVVLTTCVLFSVGALADDGGPRSLAACMKENMARTEEPLFAQWIFGALAANPDAAHLSAVSESQYRRISQGIALIMDRLLTVQCRSEAVAVLRDEGNIGISRAFEAISERYARQLLNDPKVLARLRIYGGYLDVEKLNALTVEAHKPVR